jgi:cysteine-S-conjugate beta-lyase
MAYHFDTLPNRRGTDSVKWNNYPADVLPMWVADMDFSSPPEIIEALIRRARHGVFGYPVGIGDNYKELEELKETIQERLAAHYNWQVEPADLVFLPGVARGFNMACHMFAGESGSVLVETPMYPPILEAPSNAGLSRRDVELVQNSQGEYLTNWEDFASALDGQARLFILCNPHNPVGRVFTPEELERKAAACLDAGVVICSDEIHCDLVYSGQQHVPIASLSPEIADNCITLMAPTKTFNIPGLQFSFAIVQNRELRKRFIKTEKGLVGWVNLMGLAAALAAYRDCHAWLDELIPYLESNRDFLSTYLQAELPEIKMTSPQGTYLAWLDCRNAGLDGKNPCQYFLENGKVAFNDGGTFGKGGAGFVRLNFGCPRSLLEEGLERLKSALKVTIL